MKKVLFTALLATAVSLTASAQTRVGGLLGFGSEIESLALGAVGEFMIKDNMGISPQVVFFFGKDHGGAKESLWEINGNFNYYFMQEQVDLYGILGLNFATYKVKYDIPGFGSDSVSDSEIGLNLGIGSNFNVSN